MGGFSQSGGTAKRERVVQFLVFLAILNGIDAHVKLNVPRVRLPYFENLSVNFTLRVDTPGCYQWSISRSDVVTVTTPSTEGCAGSDSAVISTIPRVTSCCPATAIIFAEDLKTKESVRCDVIVDKISSIQILTTTKELHLEEAPSKFHIQGYGSKENELSTLDGVPFTWVLESPKSKESSTIIDPQSIMRFIPFSESPYKASPGIASLETRRLQGDTVLLEGIKTGSAEVIARVNDPLYKSLEARVRIIVVASLLLEPSEVWVIPGTTFPLKLWQIKHGKKHEISLPSSVYVFSVENEDAAKYDRATSQITALTYGEARVSVKDKNWVDELEEHSEALTAKVHVTQPKHLSFTVFPHNSWALVMNETYEIQVDVINADNQKILVGDNLFVETKIDPKYFRVEFSSKNGTYHIGVPIKLGSSYVTAELKKIVLSDGTETVPSPQPRVKSEMEILQNVAVNPREVVLPWDPNVMPKYELRWNPSGGNGNYLWTSSNTSVVTVSQTATGTTEGFGSANVTVSSNAYSHMQSVAKVHVIPPTRMEIVEHIVEAEIGTTIQVPLAFYTIRPNDPNKTEVPYSSCDRLPIRVDIADPHFVHDDKTHYPNLKPACRVIPVTGNALGSSRVEVSYDVEDKHFVDSVIVSTFKPLQTLEPETETVVLAVGSTKQLAFEGGPRPLLVKQSGFQKSLDVINKTVALQRPLKSGSGLKDDVYVFEVQCREIGETDAVFNIGNNKVEQSQPIIRIKVVKIICAEPAQMYFKVETALRSSECPTEGSSAQVIRVAVPNYEPTTVSVVVKDKQGRKFDNITSLKFDWIATPKLLAFDRPNFAETEGKLRSSGYLDTDRSIQTLVPNKLSGNVEIIGRVIGYREDVLSAYNIATRKLPATTEQGLFELEHAMDLTLVSDVTISPTATVSLFNHPSSKETVHLHDGSGYFNLVSNDPNKINITYNDVSKTLEIRPLRQGKTYILVEDLCLSTIRSSRSIDVEVTGIGRIEVNTEDKIPVDGEKPVIITLLDQNDKELPSEISKLVHPILRPGAFNYVELSRLEPTMAPTAARFYFKMVGKRVGTATLTFTVEEQNVVSEEKKVDVFQPLTLSPKELTVLPGNVISIDASGGPSGGEIEYYIVSSSKDKRVVLNKHSSTNHPGMFRALTIGQAKIVGKSVDPTSKKVWSEDYVDVKVVKLTDLIVVVPLTHLYEDEKMPVWFKGLHQKHEIDTDLLATASPSLTNVEWIVSNSENAEIVHIFEGSSPLGRDLRTQFHALKPGNITLQVQGYYQSELIESQKFEVDIRKYPFGPRADLGGKNLYTWVFFSLSTAYYYLFLPLLVILAVLIGTVAYNYAIYGDPSQKGATMNSSLLITSPSFKSPPSKFSSYTPSPMRTSSTGSLNTSPSRSSGHGGSGDGDTAFSSPAAGHRRLFSRETSVLGGNLYRSSAGSSESMKSPSRF